VTAIAADGSAFEKPHGQHLVVRVRPDANRRILLTGHMDTVFPADHAFQHQRWLDEETLNGPGVADMKGGIAVMLHALLAFEQTAAASSLGYDVLINSDEETGSLASAALIADLAAGKLAALTYEPAALPDGTLAHERGGTGNYSITFTGRSAHAGRNPHEGRNAIVAAADLILRLKALESEEITINPAKLEDFLGAIVQVYGPKMLRYKGVLFMKGSDRKVVFQGVHQLMGSDLGPKWAPGEKKQSKMVFIGIDLPRDVLLQGLEQCLV
jgi:glutamate carboxypeptidase